MAIVGDGCFIQRSACALRITRLGADCSPVAGVGNGAIATAIATITATPDVTEGTSFNPTDACGRVVFSAKDPSVTNRYTFEMELIGVDYEFIEIATSSSLILGASGSGPSGSWANKAIGIERPGPTTANTDGFGLEVWVKNGAGTGSCGPASTNPPYVRHVFPRVLAELGARTFTNEVANATFSGTAEANISWGEGPYGDFPGATVPGGTPWMEFFDVAANLPEAECGAVEVPAYGSGS